MLYHSPIMMYVKRFEIIADVFRMNITKKKVFEAFQLNRHQIRHQ